MDLQKLAPTWIITTHIVTKRRTGPTLMQQGEIIILVCNLVKPRQGICSGFKKEILVFKDDKHIKMMEKGAINIILNR